MEEALYYTNLPHGRIRCDLCPHRCVLSEGERGICLCRKVMLGKLFSENYGKITALNIDPIEKKPLYHYHPGSMILSIGSYGCNLRCGWCQNFEIARSNGHFFESLPVTPTSVCFQSAVSSGSLGVAYTYNEPVVWFEYMMQLAISVKEAGLKNVVVTNGYISKSPLDELLDVADAFNIDLKGFNEDFYRHQAQGNLRQVLGSLKTIASKGAHLEITFLLIPGLNDNAELFSEMAEWIAGELGPLTVLHINRYFPAGDFHDPPTPLALMNRLHYIAKKHLEFVYLGNVKKSSNTRCPSCGNLLVQRQNYNIQVNDLRPDGSCEKCGEAVICYN
jgi:pyruvate formate lyase activating enzyme